MTLLWIRIEVLLGLAADIKRMIQIKVYNEKPNHEGVMKRKDRRRESKSKLIGICQTDKKARYLFGQTGRRLSLNLKRVSSGNYDSNEL